MKRVYYLLICLVLVIPSLSTSAQQMTKQEMIDLANTYAKGMIRVADLEAYIDYHLQAMSENSEQTLTDQANTSARAPFDEILVSDDVNPESEVHAAINPTDSNNIICSPIRSNPTSMTEPLRMPVYYSNDFGETWQQSSFNSTPPAVATVGGGGDPVLVYDTQGNAYMTWLILNFDLATFTIELGIYAAKSTDGGATWTYLTQQVDSGSLIDKVVDKQWMAVDLTQTSPYTDNVYTAYLTASTLSGEFNDIYFKKLEAGASNFVPVAIPVNSGTYSLIQFSSLDVDTEGNVYVSFMGSVDGSNLAFYIAKSTDGGDSFGPEIKISDVHFPTLSGDEPTTDAAGLVERIYPCPHIRINKASGSGQNSIHAVWTANGKLTKETDGLDIYYSRSEDGGDTWLPAMILNDDESEEAHQFYPSIDINKQGVMVVTWYDRRDDAANVDTHYYIGISYDNGTTWEENEAITTETSDFNVIGSTNADFGIGEYTQVVTSNGYAIPFWADGRTNNGGINIYMAKIPLRSGIPSSIVEINTISDLFAVTGPFPNPVTDGNAVVNISLKDRSSINVSLFSMDGKLIKTYVNDVTFNAGDHTLNLEGALAAGTYILKVSTDFGYKTVKVTSF